MQTYRFGLLLLSSLSFFFSGSVFAGSVVQTEFEMLLPKSFQQNLIEQEWQTLQREEFHLDFVLPDQTYDTPDVKVFLTGLRINVKSKLEKPALGPGGESIILQSRALEGDLGIQTVNIDQYIEREVGGVIGRFHVQARCEGVNLHLKQGQGTVTMQLSPVFDRNFVRAHVDDANLTWTKDAWEINAMTCSGAQGLDDLIKQEVLKLTADAEAVVRAQKANLLQYVQNYVSTKSIDLSKPRSLVGARPDIKMSMAVTDFSGKDNNAMVRGLFRVEFTRLKSNDEVNLKLGKNALPASSSAMIRVPEAFVLAVAKQAYAGNSWSEKVSSYDLPGFSTLMNSRFTQFFVWRELMDYPKNAKFMFEFFSPKNVDIKGSGLTYDMKAPLYAKMTAPKPEGYVPFMNFYAPLSSKVKLSLFNGVAAAKFTNVSMELKGQWDPSYVAKYDPAQTFESETIRKRLVKAAEGQEIKYTLPKIPVADQISLNVQKVQSVKGGDLVLYLTTPNKSVPTPENLEAPAE